MPLIVTRPQAQGADWVARLQALGVPALALPLIDIVALQDPGPLRAAWESLPACAMVMFVSANAVEHFFAAAPGPVPGWPAGVRAASTGPGTSAALRAAGVPEALLVEPVEDAPTLDSEALWDQLRAEPWAGRRVLVVRGEEGRDWLADTLRRAGAELQFVASYRRQPPPLAPWARSLLLAALAQPATHVWHFSSSEGIANLQAWGRALQPPAAWSRSRALAAHPRIMQTAGEAGFGQVDRVGPTPQAVADWLAHRPSLESSRP